MSIRRVLAATAALAFLMTALAGNAAAHASANSADGKVRVTWGFLDEPAYTHQKNRLDLIIRDAATGAGIGGIAPGALTVALRYGEQEYDLGEVTANRGALRAAVRGD
ncbi:MAG TPA: hypothetical protein VM582_06830, partial [Candidatus Thermoplasmatota archaeon]|nr:hypothetical protein [Candidatus Thermoplasmatota archaeon]